MRIVSHVPPGLKIAAWAETSCAWEEWQDLKLRAAWCSRKNKLSWSSSSRNSNKYKTINILICLLGGWGGGSTILPVNSVIFYSVPKGPCNEKPCVILPPNTFTMSMCCYQYLPSSRNKCSSLQIGHSKFNRLFVTTTITWIQHIVEPVHHNWWNQWVVYDVV